METAVADPGGFSVKPAPRPKIPGKNFASALCGHPSLVGVPAGSKVITFLWLHSMPLLLQENIPPNPLAKEELNFLARLLGRMEMKSPSGPEPGFRLNLFTTDEEEEYVFSLFL